MVSCYRSVCNIVVLVASLCLKSSVNAQDQRCKDADPGRVTYYPVEGNCAEYIECFNGVANTFLCSTGTWWHQAITDCDFPGPYCSGWLSEICVGTPSGTYTYLPVKGNCSQFVECYDEVATWNTCAPGTWWHQEILDCDYPGDYCTEEDGTTTSWSPSPTTSSSTTYSPTTTISSTSDSPTTPGHGPDPRCVDNNTNYWSHPAICKRFIECYEGNSYEMACPPNLYFSELKKECVDAAESECCVNHDCS